MQGTILKGIAGFYYVWADGMMYECKARGKFRNSKQNPLVGDLVELSEDTSSTASQPGMLAGTVDRLLPRKNEFDRPPISNVDTVIIVAASKDPQPLPYIIDRMAVSAEEKGCEIIICVNKSDLGDAEKTAEIYRDIYPTFAVSTKSGEGIDKLKSFLSEKRAALSGPSGVGKSSLTNALLGEHAEVGDISEKTLRGKNTTRHSELFRGDGFFLFDTPGFTSFEAPEIEIEKLQEYFPDFRDYIFKCRFADCAHQNEPDCALKAALAEGKIKSSRYESYLSMYAEIKEKTKF